MLSKLCALLPEGTAALIISEVNRRYFTGFSASDGVLAATRNEAVFFTDSRYIEAARRKVTVAQCRELKSFPAEIPPLLKELGCGKVLLEASRLTVQEAERYTKALAAFEASTDGWLDEKITDLRMVKNTEEISKIRQAQAIAEQGFSYILDYIKVGRTEKQIQLELDYTMLRLGAEALSFDTIAVSGKNSSMPHGVPTEKTVEEGDFITLDFGAVVDGYHSDMTRTVAVGWVNEEQEKVYETVLNAQTAALATVRAGITGAQGDAAARDVIKAAGYGAYFGHGTGHGVGIEIHEEPRLSPAGSHLLREGEIVTVEPGIYLPGKFGVRIEDMVAVGRKTSENLTKAPKNLIVL